MGNNSLISILFEEKDIKSIKVYKPEIYYGSYIYLEKGDVYPALIGTKEFPIWYKGKTYWAKDIRKKWFYRFNKELIEGRIAKASSKVDIQSVEVPVSGFYCKYRHPNDDRFDYYIKHDEVITDELEFNLDDNKYASFEDKCIYKKSHIDIFFKSDNSYITKYFDDIDELNEYCARFSYLERIDLEN